MIMPSNNSSTINHFYAGRYPGKVGWLLSPFSWKNPPYYMPYAIDNGAYTRWEPENFMKALSKTTRFHSPMWIVVPDVVGDAEGTFKKWHYWHRRVAPYGRLAFALQDEMEPQDIPPEAYCAFVGGSDKFKKRAGEFKGIAPWLHVGRVNGAGRIRWAKDIGADSIDGSGFFRGETSQYSKAAFIENMEGNNQKGLFE